MQNTDHLTNLEPLSKAWFGLKALKHVGLSKLISSFLFSRQIVFFLFSLGLVSCQSTLMTRPAYEGISLGSSITDVQMQVGSPYEIVETNQPGMTYHRYVERIEIAPGCVSQNTYTLTVADGKVVDKQASANSSSLDIRSP